jgi:NAD(P)-dependent dehydrogenase (short-subunit alcohol dehydrogenase family)
VTPATANPTYDFKGRVALVTGAGSGMGLATARALAAHGASVTLADINQDALRGVADELIAARQQVLAVATPPTNRPTTSTG